MQDINRQIKALEFALDYVPGEDDNHSHSVLQEILHELVGRRDSKPEGEV